SPSCIWPDWACGSDSGWFANSCALTVPLVPVPPPTTRCPPGQPVVVVASAPNPVRVKLVAWIVASELAEQTATKVVGSGLTALGLTTAVYQYLGTSPVVVSEKEPVASSGPLMLIHAAMGLSVLTPPEIARSPGGHWTESKPVVSAGMEVTSPMTTWASSPA